MTFYAVTDLETTGLYSPHERILEISCRMVDEDFEEVEHFHRVIQCDQNIFYRMDPWCKKTHTENRLVGESLLFGVDLNTVQNDFVQFLKRYRDPTKDKPHWNVVLTGQSIANLDIPFLLAFMPEAMKNMHYRVLDLTSIRQLARAAGLKLDDLVGATPAPEAVVHRAPDDTASCLAELHLWRELFKQHFGPLCVPAEGVECDAGSEG